MVNCYQAAGEHLDTLFEETWKRNSCWIGPNKLKYYKLCKKWKYVGNIKEKDFFKPNCVTRKK